AEFAALEFVKKMNLQVIEVISIVAMYESEGTRIGEKGSVPFDRDLNNLVIPEEPMVLTDVELRLDI
ncbi:OAM dimerization domain-containing protein, partial [Clostridioides difficile]|uniref:OAM dimerization domain-containing protein n=1 Tax=Clostridioides difficile TaxID=1496 RepID=UPI001F3CF850